MAFSYFLHISGVRDILSVMTLYGWGESDILFFDYPHVFDTN